MTTNYTAIADNASALPATFNSPLTELDNAIKKNNYAATAAPGVSDDAAHGYTVGSRWIDTTNDHAYTCVDATSGAAVWKGLWATNDLAANAITQMVAATSTTMDDKVSATFVDTSLLLTMTTVGGDVLLTVSGIIQGNATSLTYLAIQRDGGADSVVSGTSASADRHPLCISLPYTGLAAGSHTWKVRLRNDGGGADHSYLRNDVATGYMTGIEFKR